MADLSAERNKYAPAPNIATLRARVSGRAYAVQAGKRPQSDLDDAKRDLAAANIAAFIEKQVNGAPPFTPAQVDQLRVLLEPARRELSRAEATGGDAA